MLRPWGGDHAKRGVDASRFRRGEGLSLIWTVAALFLLAGWDCSSEDAEVPDSGAPDAEVPDSGAPDAEVPDGGAPEAGEESPSLEDELFGDGRECPAPSALVKALRERAKQLDARARELDDRQHSLKTVSEAIDERLTSLEEARDAAVEEVEKLADIRAGNCREQERECEQQVAELRQEYQELEKGLERWDDHQKQDANAERDQELKRLTKAINAMRPEKAAATLGALDHDTAAELISELPERSSGKILAALNPTKTAAIVETLLAQAPSPERNQLRELGRLDDEDSPDDDADDEEEEEMN